MPFVGSSTQATATPTTVTMFNVSVPVADTEVSQALPSNTKEFILRTRNRAELKLAYTATESGTKFFTVRGNAVFVDSNLYSSQTIYFQSPTAGTVVELIAYT